MLRYILLGLISIFLVSFVSPAFSFASTDQFSWNLNRPVRSASELSYPPFAIVTKNGEPDGFSVDLLKAVCRTVGVPIEMHVGPWNEIKLELRDGVIDVLPLVSYSEERDKYFDFSVPYLHMSGTIFVRKGDSSIAGEGDLKGKEVMVMRGDTAHEYAVKNNLTDKLILTDNYEDAMRMLSDGKYDAVLIQQLVGWQLVKKLGLTNLEDIRTSIQYDVKVDKIALRGFEQKFCFAVREGDTELLGLLNEGLAVTLADGTYNALYNKWFAAIVPVPEMSLSEKIKSSLYIIIPAMLLLSIIGLLLLKKRVRQKTQYLQEEIKKRELAESYLSNSIERYQTLVNNCGEGLAVIQKGLYKYVNPKYTELTGYSEADLLESAYLERIDPSDHKLVSYCHERVLAGEFTKNYQLRFVHADGSVAWHEISGTRVEWEDEPANFIFVHDVTEKRDVTERLLLAKVEAEKANKAKSMFLANMSHELRTPLNGIMGMHQLLQMTTLQDEQREYVEAAIHSSERLTRLLSDILDLSRVEADMVTLEDKPFDLEKALYHTEALFKPIANNSGLDLVIKMDPSVPKNLIGDVFRLQQVINNLLGNAFKFTKVGGVELEVSLLPLSTREVSHILLMVSDSGIGLPYDRIDDLFSPFVQAEGDYSRKFQGAGLGLAIVKNIVKLMGGNISIDINETGGTTFYIALSFKNGGVTAEPEMLTYGKYSQIPFKDGFNGLVVEDDEVSRYALVTHLQKMGLNVEVACNGQECLDMVRKSDFDIVFMDIQMPVMDGLEATKAIRAGERDLSKKKTPIVAVTAYVMEGDKAQFLSAGMDAYLSKPISFKALQKVLEEQLASQ